MPQTRSSVKVRYMIRAFHEFNHTVRFRGGKCCGMRNGGPCSRRNSSKSSRNWSCWNGCIRVKPVWPTIPKLSIGVLLECSGVDSATGSAYSVVSHVTLHTKYRYYQYSRLESKSEILVSISKITLIDFNFNTDS